MIRTTSTSTGRSARPWVKQRPGFTLLLVVFGTFFHVPSAEAAVCPQPPTIAITNLADYPEKVFALYLIGDLGHFGPALDRGTPTILPAHTPTILPAQGRVLFQDCGEFAVVAVPRELAEKAKGKPDPAWLEPHAPGVVRVAGTIWGGPVYRVMEVAYRLDKTDTGLKLTLLNPEELEMAQREPAEVPFVSPPETHNWEPLFLWSRIAASVLLVAACVCFLWRKRRGRKTRLP